MTITLSPCAEKNGKDKKTNTNSTYDFGFLPDCNCINTPGNILVNGSFESGTTGWNVTGGALTVGNGYVACGSKNGFNAASNKKSVVYQDVTLSAGTTIIFSGFAGTHTAGLSCSPQLSLLFINSAGAVLSQSDVAVTQNVDQNFSQLAYYTITAKAPVGTAKVRVQSSTTCNYVKMDAFCLKVAANGASARPAPAMQEDAKPVLPAELTLALNPNPSRSVFNIIISSNDIINKAIVKIYTMDGRLVESQLTAANTTRRVNVDRWQTGVYFVRVTQGGQQKMIKAIKTY